MGSKPDPARRIEICPRCGRKVEASDYLTYFSPRSFLLGMAGNWLHCRDCAYRGPPLLVAAADYAKLKFSHSVRRK